MTPEPLPSPAIIRPDWPAADNVRLVITTRQRENNGATAGPFGNVNLAYHVGDDPQQVQQNWQQVTQAAQLPETPKLVQQVHGQVVLDNDAILPSSEADGIYTDSPGRCCAILTADCLPVLLCNRQGNEVAALHAGWRGLAGGIVESGIGRFQSSPDQLIAFLGPAISQAHFEVGDEVRDTFLNRYSFARDSKDNELLNACFTANHRGRWMADIYVIATVILNHLGVNTVFGGSYCSYAESERFYSYRRESVTGRMASIIWFE